VVAQAVILVSWGVALPAVASLVMVGSWVSWLAARGKRPLRLLTKGLWTDRESLEVNMAPLQFAFFIVYGGFIIVVWSRQAALGRALVGWLATTVLLSPTRSWHRIRSFFVFVGHFFGRESDVPQLGDQPEAEVRDAHRP
jgi:hypothetical protein